MSISETNARVDFPWAERLLDLPTAAEQLAFLHDAERANASGLLGLLDTAAGWIRSDPAQARRLAAVCATLATQLEVSEALPRAAYIQAQTYALAGAFDQALDLIYDARAGYTALGQRTAALRTTAGLMHVLGESGRYQEALQAGQAVLDEIGRAAPDDPALSVLAAHIQQNMGMCYNLIGRYEKALEAYDAAETLYLALEMTAQAADISNNRGVLLWELGRGSEALAALEKSFASRAESGETQLLAQSLSNIGSAHLLLGNYTASLEVFERARRLFASLDKLVDEHVLLLDTATAYLTLNLYPEAAAAYQEASRSFEKAQVVHHRARSLWGFGAASLAQGKLDVAEKALAEAVALLQKATSAPTPLLATILLEQSAVQAAWQHYPRATATAEEALYLVQGQNWPVQEIYAYLQLADLARDNLTQAEAYLSAAQRLAEPIGLPHFRYRLQQRFGRLRRLQGRSEEAQMHLEAAIGEIERLRGTLANETLRTAFLDDKAAAYDELILLHLAQDDERGKRCAFEVAEQARSRALLDLVTGVVGVGGVVASRSDTEADAADLAQLQKLQADLNAVYNELLNYDGLNGGNTLQGAELHYPALQARAGELERAINQLRLRLMSGEARNRWAIPLTLQGTQAQLPEDVTLVVYHTVEAEIFAFIISRHTLHIHRHVSQVEEVQAMVWRLGGLLDRLRAGQTFNKSHIPLLEKSARRVLSKLYQELVAPLEPLFLKQAGGDSPQKLTIVPHGILHQVPFHALFDEHGYLIDRFEITCAPSATIDALCRQRPTPQIDNALLLGVPDATIPAVAAEVEAIHHQLPAADVLLDQAATLAALQEATANRGLLHLACHGLFRADNPMFSALKLHDGWLTATAAMQLDLSNALVTLSACESGRSQVSGGDEVLGLLRAFLGAGASTVVVSLWLAQDETTAWLMSNWYKQLQQGMTPAAALRAAQLALKAEYPHPYYWAPFIAVGRR